MRLGLGLHVGTRRAGAASSAPVALTADSWYYSGSGSGNENDNWEPTAMVTARNQHVSVAGPDGKIYSFGGSDASGTRLSDIEVFDPVANQSSAFVPSGAGSFTGVWAASGITVGQKTYIFGGRLSSNDAYTDLVQIFDWSAESWSAGTVVPIAARYRGIATDDTDIFLVGGLTSGGDTSTVSVYNIAGDSWSTTTALPGALDLCHAAVQGDYLWMHGGATSGFIKNLRRLDYKEASPAWSTNNFDSTFAQGSQSKMHAIGTLIYSGGGATQQMEEFDTVGESWTTRAAPPRLHYLGQPVLRGGVIYQLGGLTATSGGTTQAAISAYVPPAGANRPF